MRRPYWVASIFWAMPPGARTPGRTTIRALCAAFRRLWAGQARRDELTARVCDLIRSRGWRQVWQSAMVNRAKRSDRRHLIDSARHPRRRDGAIAVALLLLPWVVAWSLVRRHHHLDGGTVAILVSLSLGLPSLWPMWTTYRGPKRANSSIHGLNLGQVADQLAIAVGSQ